MTDPDPNPPNAKDGWDCPHCHRSFARRGQRHVCGTWTVDQHLDASPDWVGGLFHRFSEAVAECGPFEYAPIRVQVGFRVHRVFAGVELRPTGLSGYLDLARRVQSDRFTKVMPYTKRLHVHRFALTSPEQIDTEFKGWLLEAYQVGEGRHLQGTATGKQP